MQAQVRGHTRSLVLSASPLCALPGCGTSLLCLGSPPEMQIELRPTSALSSSGLPTTPDPGPRPAFKALPIYVSLELSRFLVCLLLLRLCVVSPAASAVPLAALPIGGSAAAPCMHE